jgi:hypothetical protein
LLFATKLLLLLLLPILLILLPPPGPTVRTDFRDGAEEEEEADDDDVDELEVAPRLPAAAIADGSAGTAPVARWQHIPHRRTKALAVYVLTISLRPLPRALQVRTRQQYCQLLPPFA